MLNNISVQNTSQVQPISQPIVTQNTLPTTNTSSSSIKNDSVSWSNTAQSSNQTPQTDIRNAQAGFSKKLFNGIGNMFGKVADMVGMGTFSRIAKNQFIQNDLDKSNQINQQEFTAVGQMIQKSFQSVDRNSNGEISLGEFKTVVKDIIDAEMKMTDTSGDGFVNYNEATTRGLVTSSGPQDSFTRNDINQDGLLSTKEFANLLEEQKFRKK